MKKIKKLRTSGTVWNALGSIMFGVNSVLLLTAVSRSFDVEASGVFGIAFTTAQLLRIVGIFGVGQFQMTDYREQYSFSVYSRVKLITCALMAVCTVLSCLMLRFNAEKTMLTLLLSAYMMAHAVSELYQNRFFQLDRLDLSGKSLFFRTLFSLVCFVPGLLITKNLFASAAILALANIAAIFLFSYFPCRQFLPAHTEAARDDTLALLKACLPLFISMFLMNFIMQLPKYAIEKQDNDTMQGIFNMIFMPAQVINLISSFIYRPMLKHLSDALTGGDRRTTAFLIGRQLVIIAVFTCVCCLGAWICGIPVLGWFYHADLNGQLFPLILIIIGGGLFACCQLIYYIILILRRQKLILFNYALCLAASFFLCPLLVEKRGIVGAALSFVMIQFILLAVYIAMAAVLVYRSKGASTGGEANG